MLHEWEQDYPEHLRPRLYKFLVLAINSNDNAILSSTQYPRKEDQAGISGTYLYLEDQVDISTTSETMLGLFHIQAKISGVH